MIDICTISLTDFDPLCVNEKEVMRYLHTEKMDDGLKDIYTSCVKKVYEVSSPRAVFKRLDISVSESAVDFGFMKVSSKSLAKNLR